MKDIYLRKRLSNYAKNKLRRRKFNKRETLHKS